MLLATQCLSPLPTALRDALHDTVRSQGIFQVDPTDARVLARTFAPTLDERDLRTLPAHEVALRLSVNGRTTRPMTGLTRPLLPQIRSGAELISRERYGAPRRTIEEALRSRTDAPQEEGHRPGQRPPRTTTHAHRPNLDLNRGHSRLMKTEATSGLTATGQREVLTHEGLAVKLR